MQVHELTFDVDAPREVVWAIFWSQRAGTIEYENVTIQILHPGDATGEGLIRHATFPVPRYLLSRGRAKSWEWLTQVKPPESWRYDAVGGPPLGRAEGTTMLEDLGGDRTRVRFRETFEVFNPVLRVLLERRLHRFISKNNDRLMREGIETGVQAIVDAASDR